MCHVQAKTWPTSTKNHKKVPNNAKQGTNTVFFHSFKSVFTYWTTKKKGRSWSILVGIFGVFSSTRPTSIGFGVSGLWWSWRTFGQRRFLKGGPLVKGLVGWLVKGRECSMSLVGWLVGWSNVFGVRSVFTGFLGRCWREILIMAMKDIWIIVDKWSENIWNFSDLFFYNMMFWNLTRIRPFSVDSWQVIQQKHWPEQG